MGAMAFLISLKGGYLQKSLGNPDLNKQKKSEFVSVNKYISLIWQYHSNIFNYFFYNFF